VANQITSAWSGDDEEAVQRGCVDCQPKTKNRIKLEILLDSFHGLWSGDNEEAMQRGCVHCQPKTKIESTI